MCYNPVMETPLDIYRPALDLINQVFPYLSPSDRAAFQELLEAARPRLVAMSAVRPLGFEEIYLCLLMTIAAEIRSAQAALERPRQHIESTSTEYTAMSRWVDKDTNF